jgi:hypothetical protein
MAPHLFAACIFRRLPVVHDLCDDGNLRKANRIAPRLSVIDSSIVPSRPRNAARVARQRPLDQPRKSYRHLYGDSIADWFALSAAMNLR